MSPDIQDKVKAIKKKMSELCIDYCKHEGEESTILEFTEEELGKDYKIELKVSFSS